METVRDTYKRPPKLHRCFSPITNAPLHAHLLRSMTHSQCWLSRLNHQIETSKILRASKSKGLSLKQAFKRADVDLIVTNKYPP